MEMESYFVCTDCGKVVPSDFIERHTKTFSLSTYRCSSSWVYGPSDSDDQEWKNIIEIVVVKGKVRGFL